MDILNAMQTRHSVRSYLQKPLEDGAKRTLQHEINTINRENDLHFQLVTDEPKAFDGFMAHYGKFSSVTNYIALVGKKSRNLDEVCGYHGERLVLLAQQLGLNTCWVALTYKKIPGAFQVEPGEKLTVVIALGYGATQGVPHKSKPAEDVAKDLGAAPEWFRRGVNAALLAPTAMNQQKFALTLENGRVLAKAGAGFYTKVDLGIVKYHFETAAGKENFQWQQTVCP